MQLLSQVYIKVQSMYLESQSTPEQHRYVFAYTMKIHNISKKILQLISRYWIITNGNGKITQIHGEGVAGKKPYINPGNNFYYTSGTVLETPIGIMQGHYIMVDENNDVFHVEIPIFRLAIQTYIH
ncbi:Co2+/Mg2+ efflux protein ApaG [Enterobacteriaceae endosymbiont of Macroplea appendiculata]|uniref:Co2+/Mg2+ efflux protein ApaG n=1 Tax=Enterobacteriaceae endosymbiont of Macroplea appendiculata TaxID=2675790 RepID=UPI0014496456|nr:Co2+/Mg2+ efflux protein ApaG [Enterobacteriaceae endosymbiont of Macroplea appendiculata]QJC30785.1 Co2+/Mg2+ efflux protein ApaG [Enterobacteriaceae endosymbiont of Macroplea appendiculata]